MKRRRSFGDRCYNPFQKDNHKISSGLRTISSNLHKKYFSLSADSKVCRTCGQEVTELSLMSPLFVEVELMLEDEVAPINNSNAFPIFQNDILSEVENGRLSALDDPIKKCEFPFSFNIKI